MRAILESDNELEYPGVKIQSETPEEAQRLKDIWCGHGGMAAFDKLSDGNYELAIAPTPDKNVPGKNDG